MISFFKHNKNKKIESVITDVNMMSQVGELLIKNDDVYDANPFLADAMAINHDLKNNDEKKAVFSISATIGNMSGRVAYNELIMFCEMRYKLSKMRSAQIIEMGIEDYKGMLKLKNEKPDLFSKR